MKLKDFFRSNSFKCIVVLLAIALVCGAVLAFCNDLFYVSSDWESAVYGTGRT